MNLAILRPFVLKCPQCMAPTESGNTRCKFCAAPLTWEPAMPLTKDDFFLRDEVEDDPDVIVEGVGPKLLGMYTAHVFTHQSQRFFRPTHFWIHPRCADSVLVNGIKIGKNMTLSSMGAVSGALFARGRGLPLAEAETLTPGVIMAIEVYNRTTVNIEFEGAIRGKTLVEDPFVKSQVSRMAQAASIFGRDHRSLNAMLRPPDTFVKLGSGEMRGRR